LVRRTKRADGERLAEQALRLGDTEEEHMEDDYIAPADLPESEEDNSRGRGKPTKAKAAEPKQKQKAKAAEPKQKEKTAPPRKQKTKPKAAAEAPAEEEPATAEPPRTGTVRAQATSAKSKGHQELALPFVAPGAEAKNKPAARPKAKANADEFLRLPTTVRKLEEGIPQFDEAAYDIMAEMDPDFDEEINALKAATSPDICKYLTMELDRSEVQLKAIKRKWPQDSEAMDALSMRRSELQLRKDEYTMQAKCRANDGTWTDPFAAQDAQTKIPEVRVDDFEGGDVDHDGDVNMQMPEEEGE
jgi:hypothetical protein